MARERVVIPIDDLPSYESAARLFAVLAYPDDKKRRQLFEDALCNKFIREFSKNPEWSSTTQAIRPRHALMDAGQADSQLKRGVRIINDERLIAAKMGAPAFAEVVQRVTGIVHPGLKAAGPTSDDAWTAVAADLDQRRKHKSDGNKGNVISRAWSPSRPVIHLCLALHGVIHRAGVGASVLGLGDFLFDRGLVAEVVNAATPAFEVVQHAFGIRPDDLIEVIAA